MSQKLIATAIALLSVAIALDPAAAAEVVPEQRILGGSREQFGSSVAVRDGLMVVGAPSAGGGEVGVYERADGGAGPWEETALLTGAGDFGAAVAVQAGRIVVGADSLEGSAHVFEPDGEGGWSEVATLVVPEGAQAFGGAVALDGDTVVVGAYRSDSSTGAAWVFQRDAGGPGAWGQVAPLVPFDGTEHGDRFGISVALEGDLAVVGADRRNPEGTVYLFGRDAGGADAWGEVDRVNASDGAFEFGQAVALSGDTLLVGAPGSEGSAHFFERQGDGSWVEAVIHVEFSFSNHAGLGYAVAVEGDLAVVGMPEYEIDWLGAPEGSEDDSGNAFVFARDAGGAGEWGVLAELQVPDADPELAFGVAAAVDGDTVFVGDWGSLVQNPYTPGSVTVARLNELVLSAGGDCPGQVTATLSGATPGGAVLLLGGREEGALQVPAGDCADTVVEIADPRPVGLAPAEPDGSLSLTFQADSATCGGLAQAADLATCRISTLAELPPAPLPPGVDKVQAPDTGYGDRFGYDVAADGDTLVVGARYAEAPGARSGSADVFAPDPGNPGRWLHVADLIAPGIAPNDQFGFEVAVDGGLAVVGVFGADSLGPQSGAAHLFEHLAGDEWVHVAELLPGDGGEEERFGSGVAVSGDTVAVGAYHHDHGIGEGAVYVFERDPADPSGWSQAAELLPPDDDTFWLGDSVALDGDRLVTGAPGSDTVVFYERPPGDPTGWTAVGTFDVEGGQLGWAVDIDGDVAVAGAPSDHGAGDFAGAAVVFERGGDGVWSAVQYLEPTGHGADDRLGGAVAVAGDLIAVGSDENGREPRAGAVHLFQRQADGRWAEIDRVVAPDGETDDSFGESSVALTADHLMVGARNDAEPGALAGSVYVLERP